MKKRSLHDLIVLHMAVTPGLWFPSHKLQQVHTAQGWIGSSGSRRARELAEDGTHEVDRIIYTIERRQNGKYAEYRVVSGTPRAQATFQMVEIGGTMVMREVRN